MLQSYVGAPWHLNAHTRNAQPPSHCVGWPVKCLEGHRQ